MSLDLAKERKRYNFNQMAAVVNLLACVAEKPSDNAQAKRWLQGVLGRDVVVEDHYVDRYGWSFRIALKPERRTAHTRRTRKGR